MKLPVNFNYGDLINIKFLQGKMYAIKGKSGSGKTTLLSLITILEKCTDLENNFLYFYINYDKIMEIFTAKVDEYSNPFV